MSADDHRRHENNPLANTIGQAASVLATALTEYLGRTLEASSHRVVEQISRNLPKEDRRDTGLTSIAHAFEQYRDAIGDLATVLPQIAQRATLEWQSEPGMHLVFRARPEGARGSDLDKPEKLLNEAIRPFGPDGIEMTPQLYDAIDKAATDALGKAKKTPSWSGTRRWHKTLATIQQHFGDPKRTSLPSMLEDLRHAVRAQRDTGIRQVQQELGWLLEHDAIVAYAVLDALETCMGSESLHEILRRRSIFDQYATFFRAGKAPSRPAWEAPVREALRSLGYDLSDRLSLVSEDRGSDRIERLLLDHGNDRVYCFRQGTKRPTPTLIPLYNRPRPELELYATTPGRCFYPSLDHPRFLPHRVHDARQGAAIWMVDRRAVQEHLDALHGRYHSDVQLRPWNMGAGRTPLALFAVDYRETDLGPSLEIGLACFVTPTHDPLAVGTLLLGSLPVSAPSSKDVGNAIWGLGKEYVPPERWTVNYARESATWKLKVDTDIELRVTLPRGGTRSSSRVPLLHYTNRFSQWHRSTLSRSGSQEQLRVGGHGIDISVDANHDYWSHAPATLPSTASRSLLSVMYRFRLFDHPNAGITGIRPSYSLWTEHMSSELGPACLVPSPQETEDA